MELGGAALIAGGPSASDRKKLRTPGGYKCSKCGLPKKGHVCAFGDETSESPDWLTE